MDSLVFVSGGTPADTDVVLIGIPTAEAFGLPYILTDRAPATVPDGGLIHDSHWDAWIRHPDAHGTPGQPNFWKGQMVNSLARETKEFLPVSITYDGMDFTSDVTFCVVADGERPATFAEPFAVNGEIGVLVQDLQPGTYRVFAKIQASVSETPVKDCGYFYIT